MAQHLIINLGTESDILSLKFRIRNTPVADQWVGIMERRNTWPLDHPDRFYSFNSLEQEKQRAETYIQQCIDTINSYQSIIERPFDWTQDCLNYLHNIFERYHGLLDQQNTEFWKNAPVSVQRALAELNLAVHRCESINSGLKPRFVCTWFGMPKTEHLPVDLQTEYGELSWKCGTVYLNYVEIGKTVEDLAHDQDQYIGSDAFKPFDFVSADFKVVFYNEDIALKLPALNKYIQDHREFFLAQGIEDVYNVQAMPYKFPVADIEWPGTEEQLIKQIQQRQHIVSVELK
jgi:hypothetical protein